MGKRAAGILLAAIYLSWIVSCRRPAEDFRSARYPNAGTDRSLSGSVPPKKTLILSFAGDIMAHDVNFTRPPYENIYSDVKSILLSDDLSFGNLEFPVDPRKPMSNYPVFNVHTDYVTAAIDAGFDVFSAANNHASDQGEEGIKSTYNVLTKLGFVRGIHFSGIRKDSSSPIGPCIIHINGWKIGFLAITEFLNAPGGADLVYRFDYRSEEARRKLFDLLDRSSPGVDLFILSFHGGREYSTVPTPEKVLFFEKLLDHGVDIIWAHHPHVLQRCDITRVPAAGSVIIFSNGNFISGQTWRLDPENPDPRRVLTGESAIFQIIVYDRKGHGEIRKVEAIPICNYKHPKYGMVVRRLEKLTADPSVPEKWRSFYTARLAKVRTITADYTIHNILE